MKSTVTIEEIHKEFNTSAEKLLSTAKEMLANGASIATDKAKKLEQLGFVSVKEVVEASKIKVDMIRADDFKRLVYEYSIKYPNNKFITDEDVERICIKYGLVCAPVAKFKGFVPAKNLNDIVKFNVSDNDIRPNSIRVTKTGEYSTHSPNDIHRIVGSEFIPKNSKHFLRDHNNKITAFFDVNSRESSVIRQYTEVDNSTLFICAPKKDFKVEGLLKRGLQFVESKIVDVPVPDPVVLKRVVGGNLIITAWGDEASDELVVNQKFN